jgi:AcrR family transcriptional regulator
MCPPFSLVRVENCLGFVFGSKRKFSALSPAQTPVLTLGEPDRRRAATKGAAMSDAPISSHEVSSDVSSNAEAREAASKLSLVALRERKKDQTREALAQAAFALFQDKGYEATTVAEIARAANVSRRTFFRYYATKDALLFVEDSENLEHFRVLLGAAESGDDDLAHIRRACLALAEGYMRDRDQILARARIIESSPVLGKQERQQDLSWERAIAESLLSTGHGGPNSNPSVRERRARMLAGAVFGAVRATMAAWQEAGGRGDLPRMISEALDLFSMRSMEFEHKATSN